MEYTVVFFKGLVIFIGVVVGILGISTFLSCIDIRYEEWKEPRFYAKNIYRFIGKPDGYTFTYQNVPINILILYNHPIPNFPDNCMYQICYNDVFAVQIFEAKDSFKTKWRDIHYNESYSRDEIKKIYKAACKYYDKHEYKTELINKKYKSFVNKED